MTKHSAVLLLSCPDRRGIVAAISGFIAQHGGNILHADEHNDRDSNSFLMRVEFDPAGLDLPLSDFTSHFSKIAGEFSMQWRLALSDVRQRMAILVSKYDHCLVDLLYRHQSGELACDIPCIVSNHTESQAIAETRRRTRAYAKRQVTWLRAERNVHWVDAADRDAAFATALRLVEEES